MGGMQALEWAANYPAQVESIIPISTPGRAYPQSIAYRKSQRKAIMMDPLWNNGNYYNGLPPKQGIEVARLIGFISYRTEKEFAHRFGRDHRDDSIYDINSRFEVESYLEHHGKKLAQWFDANTYLYLSKTMDLHDMGYGFSSYEEGLQRIRSKVLMLGVDSDILFPCYQQKEVVNILKKKNPNVEYREIHSLYGHDAFLVEEKKVENIISDYLTKIETDAKRKLSSQIDKFEFRNKKVAQFSN
jgi:homoserine O-acetyltransferase